MQGTQEKVVAGGFGIVRATVPFHGEHVGLCQDFSNKIRGRGDFGISSKFDQNKGPWAKICPLFTPSGAAAQARRRQQRASCCGSVGLRLQKHRTHTLPERHRQAGNARPLPVTAHSHPALIGLLPRLCPGSLPHRSMSSSATRSKGKDIKKPMEWGDTKQDKWQQCAGISRRPARAGPARSLWRCPSQRSRPKRPQRSGLTNKVGKEIFPEEHFREIRGSHREISTRKYTTGRSERSGWANPAAVGAPHA